jgi:hypothetical protein
MICLDLFFVLKLDARRKKQRLPHGITFQRVTMQALTLSKI